MLKFIILFGLHLIGSMTSQFLVGSQYGGFVYLLGALFGIIGTHIVRD